MDSKENKEKKNEITPSQYFDFIKNAKNNNTTEALKNSYSTFISLAEKYKKLGQIESMKKLCFLADVITKEEKLIEMGITTFVYRDVIEDYIETVADKTVKIIKDSKKAQAAVNAGRPVDPDFIAEVLAPLPDGLITVIGDKTVHNLIKRLEEYIND